MEAGKVAASTMAIQIIQQIVGEEAGKVLLIFIACLMASKGEKSIR